MSFCLCADRPRCQWRECGIYARWSVLQPPWGAGSTRIKFMCEWHRETYRHAMTNPIRGIDRPENAPEDWKGSLLDCIQHAEIAMAFDERNAPPAPAQQPLHRHDDVKRYTPAQLEQVMILRRHLAPVQPSPIGTEP